MAQSIPSVLRSEPITKHQPDTLIVRSAAVMQGDGAYCSSEGLVYAITFAELATWDVLPASKGSAVLIKALVKRGWVKTATGYAKQPPVYRPFKMVRNVGRKGYTMVYLDE